MRRPTCRARGSFSKKSQFARKSSDLPPSGQCAAALDPREQAVDAKVARIDAVDRRERPAEHVVEAAVLVRPLERHDVDGLLDDAHDGAVAPRVGADAAELVLGQVPALAAEADA